MTMRGLRPRRGAMAVALYLAVCWGLAPSMAAAQQRAPVKPARIAVVPTPLVTEALRRARVTRGIINHTAAQRAAADRLGRQLSHRQMAALQALSDTLLRDARQAAAYRRTSFTLSPPRLRPFVTAIGSRDVVAVATASMAMAANRAEADVVSIAQRLSGSLERMAALREQINELRDLIVAGQFPSLFTFGDPERTIQLQDKEQANALLQQLEAQLSQTSAGSQRLQLQLQDAMNNQQQVMQILSSVTKNHHDTLKAIIQNMR